MRGHGKRQQGRFVGRTSRRAAGRRTGFETLEPRLALAGLVINEFMALNTGGLQDEDGARADWIELRNTTAAPINLAGWRLTDDAADLDKWTFPAASVPAGGYLVVFASGKDRTVVGQNLHTNFALNEAGEYLALVQSDGATVEDAYSPFPAQLANISYGRGAAVTITESLVGENAPLKVHVPTAADPLVDGVWVGTGFNDAAWTAGTPGVGFDANAAGTDFNPLIETNVGAQMAGLRNTAYIRFPFEAANPNEITSLKLRIRYDDGLFVYLNGTEISSARRNAPAAPAFNSAATGTHADNLALQYEEIDLTAFRHLLSAGSNVLAIHGLNINTGSTDFLISPLLVADRPSGAVLGYMATPTPGAANQQGTLGVVAETSFSVDRGFFTSPFNVQIATATPGATIRYTLDGSAPTETTGVVYNAASPPLMTTTTTLRAAAFRSGWTPTNVETQTYIFLDNVIQQSGAGLPSHANWGYAGPDWAMDPDVVNNPLYAGTIKNDLQAVPTVSLVMPWSDWFGGAGVGIYPTASELERGTSFEYFTADGSQEFQIDGGIEVQGGTSDDRWKTDKLSLRIKFKAPYGPEKLEADLFHGGAVDQGAAVEFNTLVLDAQINYTWPYGGGLAPTDQRARAKFIQDQVVADMQNLSGGYAPHGKAAHLYINGLYWGLYFVHERADEHFAESYLGGADEDYDILKHTATTVVSGDATAAANYAAMLALVRQDLTVPANYTAAAQKIDVDGLIAYMAINYYAGNDDWAHHNWYASFNRVDPNGKWRFHSWDAEHTFKNLNYNAIQTNDFTGSPEEVHLLMMANDEYRLRFSDLVQKHMANGGVLTPAGAAAIYQARMAEVDRAIVGESARWGDSHTTAAETPGAGGAYTRANWAATQQDLLTNYFPQRTGVVRGQFAARNWLVPLGAPVLTSYGGTVASGYQLTLSKPAGAPATGVLYYTLDGSDPRAVGGGAAPGAVAVLSGTTTLTINAGVQVRTRVLDAAQAVTANAWSPEIDATFLLTTPFPLRITELHYNPAALTGVTDLGNLEFIELLNVGAQAISLDGVQITQFANNPYVFAAGQTLGAGQRIVVARSPATLQQAYGAGLNVAAIGYGNANLSNSGERVALLGPVGETLQDLVYSEGGGWPVAADGGGKSLEIIDPLGDETDPANWRASFYAGGSPGTAGLPPAVAGDFDGDGAADGNDFLAWQRGLGTPPLRGSAATGDADGDRDVDGADLAAWRGSYGAGAEAAFAASAVAAIGEGLMGDAAIEGATAVPEYAASRRFLLGRGELILGVERASLDLGTRRSGRAQWVDGAFARYGSALDGGSHRGEEAANAAAPGERLARRRTALFGDAESSPGASELELEECLASVWS